MTTRSIGTLYSTSLVGQICFFATDNPPPGWLECDGSEISRTSYANLFNIMGTDFGAGDGSTTFDLPDFRGEFLRGWDNSRGIDSGRTINSHQIESIQGHRHRNYTNTGTSNRGNNTANMAYIGWNGSIWTGASGDTNGTTTIHKIDGDDGTLYNYSSDYDANFNETRPRNYALLVCIKY